MGKEFYNADRKSLKNTLITIPHIDVESVSAIQSHPQERHVEDVYAHWQLQVSR